MALSTVTVSFDVHQLLGDDLDARRTRGYVKTNVINGTLIDTSTGETRLGDQKVTIGTDGTGTFTTWAPGADGNPVSWQTTFYLDFFRAGQRDRHVRVFGPYTIVGTSKTVTNKALTSNVATITTSTPHGLDVGNTVTIAGVDSTFNGTFTITAVTSTTVSYAKTATNVSSVASSGTLTSPNVKLTSLEEEQAVPAEYITKVTNDLDAYAATLEAEIATAAADVTSDTADADAARVAAQASEAAAAGSASAAAGSASAAAGSATSASGSASSATGSASSASTSAGTASTKAGEASTSATAAAGSATSASGSATAASGSASAAATSATAAAGSAASAATAKTAAEAAQAAAEAVGATSDAQVATNVTSGPLTGAALSASYAGLRLLDIRHYGAACDGTTIDNVAWNAALADVATKRAAGLPIDGVTWGGTTRIEVNGTGSNAGTAYNGQTTKFAVVVPSDVTVAGQGWSSIVKMTGVPATAYGNPNQNSALGVVDGSRNITFRDFAVVGENGTYATSFTAVDNNDSAAIDILLTTSSDINIQNVSFRNLYGFPIHDRGENNRVSVRNCLVQYCANGVNTNSNYGVFTGNTILNSEGFECSGAGIVITNNTIKDALGVAISAGGNSGASAERPGSIVAHNTIDGSGGHGITVNDAYTGGVVIGNTVRKTAKIGISVAYSGSGHVNFGNIIANNSVTSAGLSGASASDAIGIRVSGSAPHLLIGNRSVDGGLSGYSQKYGIYISSAGQSGCKLVGNVMSGITKDIEIDTATGVKLDTSNEYSVISFVSGATLAAVTTKMDQTHQGIETFNHHILVQHPASGVSNYTVAAGAAASAASRNSGTDALGQVNYTTAGGTTGALFTLTFARAYTTAPKVFIVATDARMAAAQLYVSSSSTTAFTISCAAAHAAGTSGLQFWVVGN